MIKSVEALGVGIAADSDEPTPMLLARMSLAERELLSSLPTERQRRQSATARIAGKLAIRRLLSRPLTDAQVLILTGSSGEPLVSVEGVMQTVSVSLAHSSRLATAFAWARGLGSSYGAGVDIEKIRPTDVAVSQYAFSRRERRLISEQELVTDWGGLAAWTAKEAAWKSMRPELDCGPDTVDICELDLLQGRAFLRPRGKLLARSGPAEIQARLGVVIGPDGRYLVALAELRLARERKRNFWLKRAQHRIDCLLPTRPENGR